MNCVSRSHNRKRAFAPACVNWGWGQRVPCVTDAAWGASALSEADTLHFVGSHTCAGRSSLSKCPVLETWVPMSSSSSSCPSGWWPISAFAKGAAGLAASRARCARRPAGPRPRARASPGRAAGKKVPRRPVAERAWLRPRWSLSALTALGGSRAALLGEASQRPRTAWSRGKRRPSLPTLLGGQRRVLAGPAVPSLVLKTPGSSDRCQELCLPHAEDVSTG